MQGFEAEKRHLLICIVIIFVMGKAGLSLIAHLFGLG